MGRKSRHQASKVDVALGETSVNDFGTVSREEFTILLNAFIEVTHPRPFMQSPSRIVSQREDTPLAFHFPLELTPVLFFHGVDEETVGIIKITVHEKSLVQVVHGVLIGYRLYGIDGSPGEGKSQHFLIIYILRKIFDHVLSFFHPGSFFTRAIRILGHPSVLRFHVAVRPKTRQDCKSEIGRIN